MITTRRANITIHFTPRYLKFLVPLILLLGITLHAHPQNTTTLTGTVTDSSAQVWGGALWVARMNVPGGSNPQYISGGAAPTGFTGNLGATTGAFSAASVGNNCNIVPTGTTWTFTLYSLTSAATPAVFANKQICGSTIDLGSYLSSTLSPPSVQASALAYAYNAAEILNSVNGNGYVNTISNTSWLFQNGAYVALGGGGGCTGSSVTGNVSFSGQIGTFDSGCLASVGSPFGVSISCTFSGTRETGNATTSPQTCTFGYSNGTPASGTLHDSVVNTVTLTTPFTSGVLAHAYTTNQTFTVNATSTGSQNASNSVGLSFADREFGGIGTAGATGATASGSTAILVGATGTLNTVGLGQQSTWGPYTPSNQNIYVLGTGSACTFTSGGFAFPMNTPTPITFVNIYGASISMYLYQSTNLLSATFTLNGTC